MDGLMDGLKIKFEMKASQLWNHFGVTMRTEGGIQAKSFDHERAKCNLLNRLFLLIEEGINFG